MKRKGEFIDEGLGTILAIIGLIILGLLAVKIYGLLINSDSKNANAFIDSLSSKIENLNDAENNTFALRGVTGWVLVAWNNEVPLDNKPEKCFDKNCLCLCKGSANALSCQENGYCRDIDRKVSVSSSLKERTFYMSYIKEVNYSARCIFLYPQLAGFFIIKNSTDVAINVDYGTFTDTNGQYSELIYSKSGRIGLLRDDACFLKEDIISRGYSGPSGGAPGG